MYSLEELANEVRIYLSDHDTATTLELSEEFGTEYVRIVNALNQLIERDEAEWTMGQAGFVYRLKKAVA